MFHYTKPELSQLLKNNKKKWYPTIDNRSDWESVPSNIRERLIKIADSYLDYQWKALPATLYLQFVRFGVRIEYEEAANERRYVLGILLLAECLENKGRFIDPLIDAIWATCEESTWSIPASNFISDVIYRPLADVDEDIVELFSSETGVQIAFAYYLVGPRLDAVTPLIRKRMKFELKKRMINGYLKRDDFRWMGLSVPNARLNNWSPWCTSNVLLCAMLVEEDPQVLLEVVWKSLKTIEHFYLGASDDGGCDEGASYWDRAGGSLFDCLELYYQLSGGAINGFEDEKVKKIAHFIKHMHISGKWYVNFSDGSASITVNSNMIYRFGKRIGDSDLCALAKDTYEDFLETGLQGIVKSPMRGIPALLQAEEISSYQGAETVSEGIYLENSQVVTARSNRFFLAAKGGYNEESHNHNDVGQFILFVDGAPLFVDVGVGIYTKQTFGPDRYDIWTMQSKYHNLPTLNGIQQHHGDNYAADHTACVLTEKEALFSLDISGAYPSECGCTGYKRELHLNKQTEMVTLTDSCEFSGAANHLELSFMTIQPWEHRENRIVLGNAVLEFDPRLRFATEEINCCDKRLLDVWKLPLWRLSFSADIRQCDMFTFRIFLS